MDDQYQFLQGFTDWVTGQKTIREKMFKEDDDEDDGKKKAGKGKKGKK